MRINQDNIEEYFAKYKDRVFAIGFNYFKNSHDAGDEVKVESEDTTTDVKSGPFKGKVKVNTQTNEDTVELDEVVE